VSAFVRRAVVLWHLKAILRLVCLNRLVILHMCGEKKVKVAHFVLFLPLHFMYQGGWEVVSPGYVQNVMLFFVLLVVVQGEAKHSFYVVSVCCEFVFCRVVGQVVNGGTGHCGFTVDVDFYLGVFPDD
jgi:hypothetical protein